MGLVLAHQVLKIKDLKFHELLKTLFNQLMMIMFQSLEVESLDLDTNYLKLLKYDIRN